MSKDFNPNGLNISPANVPDTHIARRREPTTGWPRVSAKDWQVFSDEVCRRTGQDEYIGLTMAEPHVRSTISVAEVSEMSDLVALFNHWYPLVLTRLMDTVEVKNLRVEVNSKMGGPIYARDPRKHEILRDEFFPQFLTGDFSSVKDCYTLINVRLQAEKKSKVRDMPVIEPNGHVSEVKIEGALRESKLSKECFTSRARNVYNPNVTNAFKQVVDNSIHDAIMRHAPFHHDMYKLSQTRMTLHGKVLAIDVKHFERNVGVLVGLRSSYIGENYHKVQSAILEQPYLCVATDWKTKFFVKPAQGFVAQLASGDSSVAALAKETLLCLYCAFFKIEYNLDDDEAISLALKGGYTGKMQFFNYGDDNLIYGEEVKTIDRCFAFLSRFLTVQVETPTAFLGWEYSSKRGFFLRDRSAIISFWKPERPPGPPFRPYFYLGFFLRWQTYRRYGSDNIDEIEGDMWDVMREFGITQDYMREWAEFEQTGLGAGSLPLNYITGKTYLLTDAEKDMLGQSKAIGLELSQKVFNNLVFDKFKKRS